MPTLPSLNFPQLRTFGRLRRPSRPASRPAIASRPRPSRPAPESTPLAPVQQNSFPSQQSSFTPVEQDSFSQDLIPMEEEFRTSPQEEDYPQQNFGFDNDFEIEEEEFRSQDNFRNQGQNFGAAFDSPFDNDPFSEFQSQDFGDDAAFRTLLDSQFDNQFDFKKI